MSRPYATLLFLIAMAIALPAAAQTGRVTGAVLDPTGKPVKGAIIGMQWQFGMHGFEAAKKRRATEAMPDLRGVAPSGTA